MTSDRPAETPPETPSETAGAAFLRGLVTPTLPTVLVSAVLAAVLLLAALETTPPTALVDLSRSLHGWRGARDPALGFTTRCIQLRSRPPAPGAIVILGASDIREAILSKEALAAAIEDAGGGRPEIRDLCSGACDLLGTLAALDVLPDDFRGTVVVGISRARLGVGPETLRHSYATHRLGFTSPFVDDAARELGIEPPRRTGYWLADHVHFLTPRWRAIVRAVFANPQPMRGHAFVGARRRPNPWGIQQRKGVLNRADYTEQRERNLELLARAMREAGTAGGVRFVLLEGPRNPALLPRICPDRLLHDHRPRMERFADETGSVHLDPTLEMHLGATDFNDDCHLAETKAMAQYTRILGRHLAKITAEPEEDL